MRVSYAILDIFQVAQWKRFALVTAPSAPNGLSFMRELEIQATRNKLEIMATVSITGANSTYEIVKRLKRSLMRIIVIHCNKTKAAEVFELAAQQGMISSSYLWIFVPAESVESSLSPSHNQRSLLRHFSLFPDGIVVVQPESNLPREEFLQQQKLLIKEYLCLVGSVSKKLVKPITYCPLDWTFDELGSLDVGLPR